MLKQYQKNMKYDILYLGSDIMDKYEPYNKIKKEQAIKDGVICVCKQVTERKIRRAVQNGAKRFISVKRETEAASGCGLCRPIVEDIINDELKKA